MSRSYRLAGFGSLAFALAALGLAVAVAGGKGGSQARAGDGKPAARALPIEGAWKMVARKIGDAEEYAKLPEGMEAVKFVGGGRFVWTVSSDGKILAAAGGRYTVDDGHYHEKIEATHGEGQERMLGKEFHFTWKVDGDTWLHVGTLKVDDQEQKIDEKWERCR